MRLTHPRVLGVLFIGILLLGVWIVNAVFTQKFVSFDEVALETDTIGLQLPDRADVKIRGVIIGQVMEATSNREGAVLTLGIKPDAIDEVPSNVTASLLPKTLFGEKYVELVIPKDPSPTPLKAGDRITQTQLPVEVERVLNDLYPVLRAVQPAELNYTLNALATAFEGRGDQIGENLETLNDYLKRFNPHVPELVEDMKLLADVADVYADAGPSIAATLRNSLKTGATVVSMEKKLAAFLQDTGKFANTSKRFLDNNGQNIIRLGDLSKPQLALLKRYSPEFPCLLQGVVNAYPMAASAFRGAMLHIDLITLPRQPRGYNEGDLHINGANNPPTCAGLPNPPVPWVDPDTGSPYPPNMNDGVDNLGRGDGQRVATGFDVDAPYAAGLASQKAVIAALTAPVMGVAAEDVPDLTTLLFGPLATGTEVSTSWR